MGLDKNLSNVLGIEYDPIADNNLKETQNIVPYEPISDLTDEDEDYLLVRKTMRNLIEKGNDALEDIAHIARQNESPRGFEVVANLIKTIGETSKDLYTLQKTKKDLKEPNSESDPRKKNPEGISVEQAVFVGSAAELLAAIKKQKEEDQKIIEN